MILAALWLPGCSGDDPADPGNEPAPELPASADELVSAFRQAYQDMDHDAYDFLLHEDFIFDPVDEGGYWGFPENWDEATELAIAANMFSGAPGQNPDGSYRDGIESISIITLLRQTEWVPVLAEETLYADALYALFDAALVFSLEGGENTMSVFFEQVFWLFRFMRS